MAEEKQEKFVLKKREMDHPIWNPKLAIAGAIMAALCLIAIIYTWAA